MSDNVVESTLSLGTGVTLGGTTGFSSEIDTGGCAGTFVGFEPDEPVEPGVDVPEVGAPLEEPEDPGAPESVPDEQPASTAARATTATAFLMRTILANRAKGPGEGKRCPAGGAEADRAPLGRGLLLFLP
jgi:hypothetical protein